MVVGVAGTACCIWVYWQCDFLLKCCSFYVSHSSSGHKPALSFGIYQCLNSSSQHTMHLSCCISFRCCYASSIFQWNSIHICCDWICGHFDLWTKQKLKPNERKTKKRTLWKTLFRFGGWNCWGLANRVLSSLIHTHTRIPPSQRALLNPICCHISMYSNTLTSKFSAFCFFLELMELIVQVSIHKQKSVRGERYYTITQLVVSIRSILHNDHRWTNWIWCLMRATWIYIVSQWTHLQSIKSLGPLTCAWYSKTKWGHLSFTKFKLLNLLFSKRGVFVYDLSLPWF